MRLYVNLDHVATVRQEVTTEGGLDLRGSANRVSGALERLKVAGIRTSLFIDPGEEAVGQAARLGPDAVELHTGEYANAEGRVDRRRQAERLAAAARLARELGLAVHAGHGLTYENVGAVARIRECEELNIGHSIVSRSVLVGIERAVREMKQLVIRAREA